MYTLVVNRTLETITLYVNGEVGRATDITGWGSLSNRNRFEIGKSVNSWSSWLDGDVDELGMWSVALSQEQILQLFNEGNAVRYTQ